MAEELRITTLMIVPVSKETYFNTKWKPKKSPLCAYDMLFHPPDYNQKAARSDRTEPQIIRRNIWEQLKMKIPICESVVLCSGLSLYTTEHQTTVCNNQCTASLVKDFIDILLDILSG